MDAKSVGVTIAKLRKKQKLTQSALAARLGVTDKAVSRWENGQGYPDVSLFPVLATLFGVSVDYLMTGDRRGIVIAGSMIADVVKNIREYPRQGMMAYMTGGTSISIGGCAANTSVNLAKIDPTLPISVMGRVGADENGRFIVSEMRRHGIAVDRITFSDAAPTSFCDVMSVPSGERTFFHQKGANAEFSPEDVDVATLSCDILHIGYVFLLDKFDAPDPEYGSVMARFLHKVQRAGIKTSIDMVSDSEADYGATLIPIFRYCDYVIVNEVECCTVWGIEPRRADGSLDRDAVKEAMRRTVEAGVRDRVIVHAKEACFVMTRNGDFTEVASLAIPPEDIKGSVGAGDAFCAGCLWGLLHHTPDKQLLEFASAAAACNLYAENSTDGMRGKNEIAEMAAGHKRLNLPK
ncbi:MAG: helix-turn-helix domain-containing protein [Clostridia bacterium]|nr:helix-turn-helix domain-containing protein [Clostridia bacterium]MBQ8859664.1 helix-turn-helix domain-containing protein [Clostridia bacterium]